jgi:hypothetical protein
MVGIKTTGEQLSILCDNGTIYLTNPGKKLDWPSKDTLESEGILTAKFLIIVDFPDF